MNRPHDTEGSREHAPLRRANGLPIASTSTLKALAAMAEAVFSREGRPPPADRMAWLRTDIEDFLARAGLRARLMLTFMTLLVTWLAPLFVGRLAPLGALPLELRIQALERLEARFGEPLLAVKAMLSLIYYEHPDAAREVGFDGHLVVPASLVKKSPAPQELAS
jgi:hypothetical protein